MRRNMCFELIHGSIRKVLFEYRNMYIFDHICSNLFISHAASTRAIVRSCRDVTFVGRARSLILGIKFGMQVLAPGSCLMSLLVQMMTHDMFEAVITNNPPVD